MADQKHTRERCSRCHDTGSYVTNPDRSLTRMRDPQDDIDALCPCGQDPRFPDLDERPAGGFDETPADFDYAAVQS